MTSSVTVVIPCYNAERLIADTLRSLLAQTVVPDEIIVIDDGSSDRSADVVQSFDCSLIRLVRQTNQGESVARNRGIDEAKNAWVAFLDADDIWTSTKLERQVEYLRAHQGTNLVCIHTGYYNFGAWTTVPIVPPTAASGAHCFADFLCAPVVMTSSALVRTDAGVRFPEWTRMGEDTMYFAELSLRGTFAYLPEPLVGYRRTASQQTRATDHLAQGHAAWMRWLDLHQDLVTDQMRAETERRLLSALLERLRIHKWRRQWDHYWTLRDYLQTACGDQMPNDLSERIYPSMLYSLKDWVDRMVKAS